jgi:hypothetical protein
MLDELKRRPFGFSREAQLCVSSAPENDVGRLFGGHVLSTPVTELHRVQTGKDMLSRTEQDRRNREMHLVDEPRAEVLPNRLYTPADPDVSSICCGRGLPQGAVYTVSDEMERRVSLTVHGNGECMDSDLGHGRSVRRTQRNGSIAS